ncbi:putative dehydrogenase [bacterium BMS3Bbin12]|nr:putative dehydrogenase [bacterium BMS3Abin12]GBE47202.1 putative dehydrogenase [bacterium BMS3Bbin12]GBE49617.1 putative dehydrogenase [bacterium BMS3Bbin13]HDJ86731.1 DUF1249 domain-containing protein [Chromatiales bacterium]HDK03164.1 DUF1249 domain-containing protein [Gammaproteobacteria bacterium]
MEQHWQYLAGGYPRRTFAGLMALYETNYARLLALVPHLHIIPASGAPQVAPQVDGSPDLHLTVLERTRYTTILLLTYYFRHRNGGDPVADPDARLRVYHDARLVEVLSCRDGRAPRSGARSGLMHRWQANLFLEKWLNYCLCQGHRFRPSVHTAAPARILSDA